MKKFERNKELEEDIYFMNAVDAAYNRKPRFSIRMLSVGTMLAFCILLLWAYCTQIDEVARAEGQVIPSQGIQVIEHLEGGTLKELLVKEGDTVEENAVLLRISNELSQAEYNTALEKSYVLRASISRFQAELAEEDLVFEEELKSISPSTIEHEIKVYETNKEQNKAELAVLKSEYLLKEQEVKALKNKLNIVQKNLALNRTHLKRLEALTIEELTSQIDLLKQQEIVLNQESEIINIRDTIYSLNIEKELAKEKYSLKEAEYQNASANALHKAQAELASLKQSILLGSSRKERTDIRSPVYGKVKSVFVKTINAVIKPASPIMEIVPLDTSLLIEAKIQPADIGFIQQGQKAIVKITAFDYSVFGGLYGIVEQISADTIEDKEGKVYYIANIRTEKNYLEYKDKQLEIIPGMVSSVDILTGKKSVLTFILKPIIKTKENAFTQR